MSDHNLRDTFAAAALTGLLAQGDDGSFSEESYARGAYRWAAAMLAERARLHSNGAGYTNGVSLSSETKRCETSSQSAPPRDCKECGMIDEMATQRECAKACMARAVNGIDGGESDGR
jgi:hypothetical protein